MVLPWEFLRVEHPVDVICRVNLQTAEVRAIAAQLVIEVFLNTADEPFSRNDVNCSIFAGERLCFLPRGDSRRMYLAALGVVTTVLCFHPPENERLPSSKRYITCMR